VLGLALVAAALLARFEGLPSWSILALFGALTLYGELKAVDINGVSCRRGG